ncbi:MAG TPA: hypothetical protein VLA43_05315 [Longimicrobiales bacterium]|nr:hypothetical protein [Longimicrobiales bacterium]
MGEAHLLATWDILRAADGVSLAHGTTESSEGHWTVGDFDALVHLLSAGVDALANDLLRALESLPPRPPAPEPDHTTGPQPRMPGG